jgi:hypothetical protein
MSDGVVSRLHLRVPQGHLGPTRARIEDALSRAGTDERLLLLRRLDFGRMQVGRSAAYWAQAAGLRIADARSRAVHGASPGAERADAVWFHSSGEAWMLLLLRLASGSIPAAWFWRLAVPGWNGAPLSVWLPEVMREAARNPEVLVRAAHALAPVIEAGVWERTLAALAATSAPMPQVGEAPRAAAAEASAIAAAMVRRLIERLMPAALASIAAAMHSGAGGPAARAWLARLVLTAHMPELAAAPLVLAQAGTALIELLLAKPRPLERDATGADATAGPARSLDEQSPRNPVRPANDLEAPARRLRNPEDLEASTNEVRTPDEPAAHDSHARDHDIAEAARRDTLDPDLPLPEIAVERVSQVAGLFLVVPALSRLGLPGWLDRHPVLAYEGFARRLLATIATRMGAGPHDPVLRALMPDETAGAESATRDAPELEAWRVGLDRWLRRKARIGLAETVRRRGWIIADAERISVRFRLDDADIRLRRRALDIDPGWVPWLGLSIHYVYRDEPRT